MRTYTFTIPGPPVGKERARRGKYGGMYTPAKTKAYEEQIAMFAREAGVEPCLTICHLDVKWRINPDGDEELEVLLTQTDDTPKKERKRPDGDNILKIVGDGLNGVGYKDDSQVHWWSIGRE